MAHVGEQQEFGAEHQLRGPNVAVGSRAADRANRKGTGTASNSAVTEASYACVSARG